MRVSSGIATVAMMLLPSAVSTHGPAAIIVLVIKPFYSERFFRVVSCQSGMVDQMHEVITMVLDDMAANIGS